MGIRATVSPAAEIEACWNCRPAGLPIANVKLQGKKVSPHPVPGRSGSNAVQRKQKQHASKDAKVVQRQAKTPEEMDKLKLKKAWEVALAPVKGLPMTAIMMYMSGNSLQIFSIMMVWMAFKNPIMGIMSTSQAFERFQGESLKVEILQVKFVYVLMQLLALALGIWKVNSMGLLPYVFSTPIHLAHQAMLTADDSQDDTVGLVNVGISEGAA